MTWWRWMLSAHLPELVAELDQRATAQHAPTVQGVTLASLHAAKGLEWDAVFLVGLTDGTVPIQRANTADQIAEERRLLYVGMTRARERLGLSWALARSPGQRRSRRPSRFLDGLRPVAVANTPSAQTEISAAGGRRGVVRTPAGLAQATGRGVERARICGLLGCDAGSDFGFPAVGSIWIGARFRHWAGQIGPIR